jgi:hypothetical protein
MEQLAIPIHVALGDAVLPGFKVEPCDVKLSELVHWLSPYSMFLL